MTITHASLLATARSQGIIALGNRPVAGLGCKVLLASLIDPSDHAQLLEVLELNKLGAITMTRVDMAGIVPADRTGVWNKSMVWSMGCRFDSIEFAGADLIDSACR